MRTTRVVAGRDARLLMLLLIVVVALAAGLIALAAGNAGADPALGPFRWEPETPATA